MRITNNKIGGLCELCKKGIILYIRDGINDNESIKCSNKKCPSNKGDVK